MGTAGVEHPHTHMQDVKCLVPKFNSCIHISISLDSHTVHGRGCSCSKLLHKTAQTSDESIYCFAFNKRRQFSSTGLAENLAFCVFHFEN